MKTSVYFEDGRLSPEFTENVIRKINSERKPEFLTVISAGDFLSNGLQTGTSAKKRARGQAMAGADLVLALPIASILGGYGKRDFASVALVQRFQAVDRIIIPFLPTDEKSLEQCEELLKRCAMLIFREQQGYRGTLSNLLKQGIPFGKAQMMAVVHCIPEAGTLLESQINRKAVRMLDAMLQLYYMVKTEFLDVSDLTVSGRRSEAILSDVKSLKASSEQISSEKSEQDYDRIMAMHIKETLENKPQDYLKNIAGSTEKLLQAIDIVREDLLKLDSFEEMVRRISEIAYHEDQIRLYLLRAILNIRHGDMLINGLHTYVPFGFLLAAGQEKEDLLQELEQGAWVPFIRDDRPDEIQLKDEALQLLLKIDRRKEQLL